MKEEWRPWTTEEIAKAIELRRKHVTNAKIGQILGRSERGVRDQLFRQGVFADLGWTREQDEIVRKNRHLTHAELARMVSGVGPPRTDKAVRRRLNSLGLRLDREPSAATEAVLEAAAYREGWMSARGSYEQRDAEFVRMVLRGWAELQGIKVAA